MKTIRIFLASSINEFAAFRRQLKDIIEQRNKKYNPLGIAFDVIICEDESRHFSKGRKQEELNRMIQACDFFILLAGRDVGKATREEFDTACRCFRDSGPAEAPKIRAFFQNYPISETTPELRWFREHVREELEQYPDKFDHTAEVEREVLLELADSLAFSSSDQLEAGRRKQEEIAAEITKNRKEAAALCKDGVTAENLLEAAELYAKNAALSEESGMAWRTLEEYAAFLYRQGSYRRAIETAAKLDKHYGPADDPDERAGVKVLLGRCHMELDEYEAAEDFFRAALDLYRPLAEESPEDYAPDAAEVCVLLAGVMVKTFRLRAAERLYREALGLYLPCGLEEPEEYASWVGQVCHALRRLISREANRSYEAEILQRGEDAFLNFAVRRDGDRLGPEGENLSCWLDQFPCPDEAGQILRQAEEQARERTKEKPEEYEFALAAVCWQFGDYLREHNRMEDAETLFRKSLDIRQKLAEKDPQREQYVAVACNSLGQVLQNTRRPVGVERRYRQAVEIYNRLAEEDPAMKAEAAIDSNNLANLFQDTGRLGEAEKLHREALEIRRRLGEQDAAFERDIADSCHNLANTLRLLGQTGEAEILWREALEIRRRLAARDPDIEKYVADSCTGLGILLYETGRTAEAERLYGEALEICRRLAERDPSRYEPKLARACHNFEVLLYDKKHDHSGAKKLFDEAISLLEKYPHYEDWLNKARHNRSLCLQ